MGLNFRRFVCCKTNSSSKSRKWFHVDELQAPEQDNCVYWRESSSNSKRSWKQFALIAPLAGEDVITSLDRPRTSRQRAQALPRSALSTVQTAVTAPTELCGPGLFAFRLSSCVFSASRAKWDGNRLCDRPRRGRDRNTDEALTRLSLRILHCYSFISIIPTQLNVSVW